MKDKILKNEFDLSNNKLENGFIKLPKNNSIVTFESIIANYKTSIIIVDTNGSFIKDAIIKLLESEKDNSKKLIIGLVNNETLLKIKSDGVKTGFYRSTKEKINIGLIILNKEEVYAVFDINHIYEIENRQANKEIFNMINHIIWSKTDNEYFELLREVKEIRLSVIAPELKNAVRFEPNIEYDYSSNSLSSNSKVKIYNSLFQNNDRITASIILNNTANMFGSINKMNIEVFPSYYYSFKVDESVFDYKSFSETKLNDLVNKEIYYKGSLVKVGEQTIVEAQKSVYLDEYNDYKPNYESIISSKEYLTRKIAFEVTVSTIKLDNSYTLHKNYSNIETVLKDIKERLNQISNLDIDKHQLKKIESISQERNIIRKVEMFNEYVNSLDVGVAALNNNQFLIKPINKNQSDLLVPSEIIGKLFSKDNKTYLATTMDRLSDAKRWLKDNNIEAKLIEDTNNG